MPKVGKQVKPPVNDAFQSKQLSLFQSFLCNSEEERNRLSNTIELWDGIPKYSISRKRMNKLRSKEGVLPTWTHQFQYKNEIYKVEITPAVIKIQESGRKEFFPSSREELIEDALRKIATEQNCGFLESDRSGVIFTLSQLRRELANRGHSIKYKDLVESLLIMRRVGISLMKKSDKSPYMETTIFLELAVVGRDEYIADPKSRWIVRFNSLITESIKLLAYRQFDYDLMMSHNLQLSRWLHKQMALKYTNASFAYPYTISFSTIQRDSAIPSYDRWGVRDCDEALNILIKDKVLMAYDKNEKRGRRNKLEDVVYILRPSREFVGQVKVANKRQAEARKVLK